MLLQESNLTARQPRRAPNTLYRQLRVKDLPNGPYMAARVGFEPMTVPTEGTEPTTEKPCYTVIFVISVIKIKLLLLSFSFIREHDLQLDKLTLHVYNYKIIKLPSANSK